MKWADWTNLMSYDLHGTWFECPWSYILLMLTSKRDENNPIGSIVQGHTNLTEIKQATSLLWRAGLKPEQVVMGFGFYGRSFQLSDPSCSEPGCQFSGSARPGPCSNTSGILMYYEIQAMLNQVPDLQPVHDKEAAINYVVFDKNQWVSYDDGKTFKEKLKWANDIGIGGSLIWASDTDDDKYSAMSGLVGKKVSHPDLSQKALADTKITLVGDAIGENGQDCKRMTECVDPDIVRCPDGHHKLGWDKDGCKVIKSLHPHGVEKQYLRGPAITASSLFHWENGFLAQGIAYIFHAN